MRLLCCLLLLLPAALHAAEDGRIACRLLNFQRDGGGVDVLFVVDPASGEAIECKVPRDKLSNPIRLPLADRSLVFRTAPNEAPAAKAAVPKAIREALVLFLPSDDPERKFQVVVIDGSKKAYPVGGCLVLNLYNENVRFIVGEHKILLPAGKTASVERPEQRNNFNMAAVIFQFRSKGGWRSAYETMSRFPEGQRHLYVTYVDPKSRRPKVRSYRD